MTAYNWYQYILAYILSNSVIQVPLQADLCRNVFRFKKGMKSQLLNQVATDDPEGMGSSSKGWEPLVSKLKAIGPDWKLLTARCARENVREMVREWHRDQTKLDKTTGTGANETEVDALLQEIYDLWTTRKELNELKKTESTKAREWKSRESGLQLRQAAVEGLRKKGYEEQDQAQLDEETPERENSERPVPAKRQRKQAAVWDFLKEVKESEKNVKEKELELRAKQLEIEAEKIKVERERLRQQEQQLELQREQQQHSFRLQQQQMEAMLTLLTQATKKWTEYNKRMKV